MNNHRVEFSDLPWDAPAHGMRVKSVVQGDKKLRLVEFSLEFVEKDWCIKEHVGLVLDGEIAININGVVQNFRAGDGLFIPRGEQNRHKHHDTVKPATLFLVEDA